MCSSVTHVTSALVEEHTLVPLPTLQSIDAVTVNNHCVDLVLINLFDSASGFSSQTVLGVANNEIDFTGDSLCRFRMVAWSSD